MWDKHTLLTVDSLVTSSGVTTDALNFQIKAKKNKEIRGKMRFEITEAVVGAGSVQFKVQDSDDGSSYDDFVVGAVCLAADLKVGDFIEIPFAGNHRPYLQGAWTTIATISAGKVTAGIYTY